MSFGAQDAETWRRLLHAWGWALVERRTFDDAFLALASAHAERAAIPQVADPIAARLFAALVADGRSWRRLDAEGRAKAEPRLKAMVGAAREILNAAEKALGPAARPAGFWWVDREAS